MKLKPIYVTPGYKGFLFFQSHSLGREKVAENELVAHASPNPLDKYRAPTLRLTPIRHY